VAHFSKKTFEIRNSKLEILEKDQNSLTGFIWQPNAKNQDYRLYYEF